MNHNRVMKLKTLNECEKMTFKQFQKYWEKYLDWSRAYSEELSIVYDQKESEMDFWKLKGQGKISK